MTYKQKIEHDYPDKIDPECLGGVEGCPHNYGYESWDDRPCIDKGCSNLRCESCWNREIPGTEPLTYEHTAVPIGKVVEMTETETGVEFKIEPINSHHTQNEKEKNMAKKTKAELEKELETIKESKAELEKELKNLEKYKQYEDMAGEVHAIYMSFVHAGFSEEQAYDLLKTMIQNANNITFNSTYNTKPSYRSYK